MKPPTLVTWNFDAMMRGDTFPEYQIAELKDGAGATIPITGGSLEVRQPDGALVARWAGDTFLIVDGKARLARREPAETITWAAGTHTGELKLTTAAGTYTYARGDFPIIGNVNQTVE